MQEAAKRESAAAAGTFRPVYRRRQLPFRSVNRRGAPDFCAGMQRHHLLPRQVMAYPGFGRMLDAIGRERLGYDDFRINGLLLPATEQEAMRAALPLHRGPHRRYNDVVAERFGQIEARWAEYRRRAPEAAREEAVMRLHLLQGPGQPFLLNRRDPLGQGLDFSELDAMAEALWASSAPVPV